MKIRPSWLDESIAGRIEDVAAGRVAPVEPRNAASVMILRDAPEGGAPAEPAPHREVPGPGARGHGGQPSVPGPLPTGGGGRAGVEVLMLRRVAAMEFAPGAYVFPGGAVDAADAVGEIAWHGPDAADFGERLGVPPEMARALVFAAVRETFEESGVLLAGEPDGPLAVPDGPEWEADRAAVISGALTLAELLSRRGLQVRADLLKPWARWITPRPEPRRFDARFFVAALPAGQRASGHAAEADRVVWLRPADAIDAARRGKIKLLPPTATNLADFARAGSVAEILASPRAITPVQPLLTSEDGLAWVSIPDEVGCPL